MGVEQLKEASVLQQQTITQLREHTKVLQSQLQQVHTQLGEQQDTGAQRAHQHQLMLEQLQDSEAALKDLETRHKGMEARDKEMQAGQITDVY